MKMNAPSWARRLACFVAGLALAILGLPANAQATASGLPHALEQAWRLHPQAAALDALEAEARAAQDIASGLTPEPGAFSIGNLSDRLNGNRGRQEWELALATPLWLPGQKAAHNAEAASRIDEAMAKRTALRWELAGELREAWWSLAAARNVKALAIRRIDNARALATDVRRRHDAGELSRIDANLAQAEIQVAETELIEADALLLQAEQTLRILTGTVAPAEMAEELSVPRVVPGAVQVTPESHPQVAAATAAARSARARVKLVDESQRAAPELALRVVRDRNDVGEPYANRVGITLKIPFSSAPQVRRATSLALAEANQADAEMLRSRTRVQLEAERSQRIFLATERQLTVTEERRTLAADSLRLAERAFNLGESDLTTLLRIRAAAYDAESALVRQRVARAAAKSRLKQSLGVLP